MNATVLLALLVLMMVMGCAAHQAAAPTAAKSGGGRVTARQIVARIQEQVGCAWTEPTVDTFKAGNPDAEVTGVAVTFMATLDVLRRAQAAGCNFVITHEPTFYNHLDQMGGHLENDAVVAEKRALLAKHGMVVWRFHDHWHKRDPDGIDVGITKRLGWEKHLRPGDPAVYDLPETTVAKLAAELKGKLGATVVRVVGKPEMKVRKVGTRPGASGAVGHIRMLQRDDVEVLLVGESPEWETVEYVRDAAALGRNKALILLGHANSEEVGMEYCAAWLRGFLGEVPVKMVAAGDPFWGP